jgi:hypothetical protein
MKLKDILAISGKPGLYQFISQGRNGIIVESFDNKKRMAVNAATKVSSLEDIAIFTETEEVQLRDVFKKFHELEGGKQTISHKENNNDLKAKFEEVIPDYDRDRVYTSDIKKVINWYNILIEFDLFDPNEEAEEEEQSDESKDSAEETSGNE